MGVSFLSSSPHICPGFPLRSVWFLVRSVPLATVPLPIARSVTILRLQIVVGQS